MRNLNEKATQDERTQYQFLSSRCFPFVVEQGETYEKLSLRVVAEAVEYAYSIHSDTRHPELATIKNHLESSFAKAIDEKLNIKVSEYKERDYLFIEFQSIGQEQYTGRRMA